MSSLIEPMILITTTELWSAAKNIAAQKTFKIIINCVSTLSVLYYSTDWRRMGSQPSFFTTRSKWPVFASRRLKKINKLSRVLFIIWVSKINIYFFHLKVFITLNWSSIYIHRTNQPWSIFDLPDCGTKSTSTSKGHWN